MSRSPTAWQAPVVGTRWIVDGNNVFGSRPDGWWRDPTGAALRLLDEIARWREETGEPVLLVLDGFPDERLPEQTSHSVEIRYSHSRARDGADDEIVRIVNASDDPGSINVVTSDRKLRERVEALGAKTEGAGRFLDRIADIPARRSDRPAKARVTRPPGAREHPLPERRRPGGSPGRTGRPGT